MPESMEKENRLPSFAGPFGELIPKYIAYKRAQGYQFGAPVVYRLREMDLFFRDMGTEDIRITREMYEAWTSHRAPEKEQNIQKRQNAIRGVAKYLVSCGYSDIYTGQDDTRIFKRDFIPYIFSKDEIRRMFHILHGPKSSHYCDAVLYNRFHQLLSDAGIMPGKDGGRQRLHNIRHTFCVFLTSPLPAIRGFSRGMKEVMPMNRNAFSYHLTKYFTEYLPNQTASSINTIQSYTDTFVQLLEFFKLEDRISPEKLRYEDFQPHVLKASWPAWKQHAVPASAQETRGWQRSMPFSVIFSTVIPPLWCCCTRPVQGYRN